MNPRLKRFHSEKMSKNFERLPKNVKPINYDIFIKANFETFKFNGRVTYNVEVLQPTKIVKMNCADIEIQNAKVQGQDAKHEFDVEQEEVSLIVENEIPVGPASITIEYTGTHNDKMKGFYRTKHVNEDGSSFYSLVTQFECEFFIILFVITRFFQQPMHEEHCHVGMSPPAKQLLMLN